MNPDIPVGSGLDEETARAEIYGLLAALYYAPPSSNLLAQLRVAVTEAPAAGAFLEDSWRGLVAAARELSDQAIADEYDALFGGVGRPEIYLYGSHYLCGFLSDKPLADLRTDLATLGLTRDETMPETEDHIAYVCEVMRFLIAGDDVGVSNLTNQHTFFAKHVRTWLQDFCDQLEQHPRSHFYKALALFTRAFVSVEAQGFDMLD